eukprot:gene7786-12260_t
MKVNDIRSYEERRRCIQIVQRNGLLNSFPFEYKKDKIIVLEADKNNGISIQYSHEVMKSNKTIAENAIIQNPSSAKYISKNLKKEDKFMTTMLKKYSRVI